MSRFFSTVAVIVALTLIRATVQVGANRAQKSVTLTLVGYSVVNPVYTDLTAAFTKYYQAQTGENITFKLSFGASGAQSRAVVSGLDADIVALSLEPDINRIQQAKLITHDWKANDYKGLMATSVVVLVVRPGNPKAITNWADLVKANVQVLTPDPGTSGGAKWNILGAYGAVLNGAVAGYDKSDADGLKFLGDVFKNVTAFDKDGQTSFANFVNGVGDVAITYEDEALDELHAEAGSATAVAGPTAIAIIYPTATFQIDNPVALVDAYVDKHGTRAEAQAFLDYLWTPDAQQIFAANGFRPVNKTVAADPAIAKEFPPVRTLFTIDQFGGWTKADPAFFGANGSVTKLITGIKGQ